MAVTLHFPLVPNDRDGADPGESAAMPEYRRVLLDGAVTPVEVDGEDGVILLRPDGGGT